MRSARIRRCSSSIRASFAAFAPRSALSRNSLVSASPGVRGRSGKADPRGGAFTPTTRSTRPAVASPRPRPASTGRSHRGDNQARSARPAGVPPRWRSPARLGALNTTRGAPPGGGRWSAASLVRQWCRWSRLTRLNAIKLVILPVGQDHPVSSRRDPSGRPCRAAHGPRHPAAPVASGR